MAVVIRDFEVVGEPAAAAPAPSGNAAQSPAPSTKPPATPTATTAEHRLAHERRLRAWAH